jgi:outer membrane protein assembly factor BamB
MRTLAIFISILCSVTISSSAADWPCWRGPDGVGVSSEKGLPSQWSAETNIAWKMSIPGKGASSPVAIGERVYVTTQMPDTGLHLIAINRVGGEILWDREVGKGKLHANRLHNMATPTAVTDGQFVWGLFGTGDLACLDRDGKIVWQRNLMKEYGDFKAGHGYGSSPMLLDGRLFIAFMHQGPSFLLALDARTGKNLWKKDRNLEPSDEAQDSYSSPVFFRRKSGTQVVLAGAENLNAYEPATGEQIWNHGGLRVPHHFGRTIAGPTAGEGMVIMVASGFQNHGFTAGLNAPGKGNIPETARAWTCSKFSPDCSTPVVYEGMLFFIRDDGMASCLDLKTGEPHWQERLFSANVKVSPVAGDGKIYFMSGEGNCAVVKAAKKLEILSSNELREATLSSPCISNGHLFLRTEEHLFCVGK